MHAEAAYTGNLALRQLPAGLDVNAFGDVLLGDVHVATLPDSAAPISADNTDELLNWQSLVLKGMKVTFKPSVRPRVEIGEVALSDFYARLVVTEQGHFNLQDVAAAPAAAASAGGCNSRRARGTGGKCGGSPSAGARHCGPERAANRRVHRQAHRQAQRRA